jgi:hypothetical protein
VGLAPNAIVGVGSVCAFADGVTTAVRFNNQCAAALDSHGTLFITDTSNKRLGAMASASGRMATGAGGSTSADNMLFGGSPTTSATLAEVIMPQSHAASPATTPSGGAGASTGNRGNLRLRRRRQRRGHFHHRRRRWRRRHPRRHRRGHNRILPCRARRHWPGARFCAPSENDGAAQSSRAVGVSLLAAREGGGGNGVIVARCQKPPPPPPFE